MVYRLTGNEKFSRDFGLRDQARRAAVSLANIAEGFFITRLCPHRNSIVISILLKTHDET
jgi:23S rRNA-intervening sequence protein